MSDAARFGEQMGDFLRGLLRVQVTASQRPSGSANPAKWAAVDVNEISTGVMASLELESDLSEPAGKLTRDMVWTGLVHFGSGNSYALAQVIAKDYCNAITLLPSPNSSPIPGAVATGIWNFVADGDLQPFGKSPYEITFMERQIPGQQIARIGGQIFDPNTQKRVNFSVTHDPIETIILAIVAGFAALICGGVVLTEAVTNRGFERAQLQCGDRGIRKLTIKRKYGFNWSKGNPDIGCGEDYEIECNPPPGPPEAT